MDPHFQPGTFYVNCPRLSAHDPREVLREYLSGPTKCCAALANFGPGDLLGPAQSRRFDPVPQGEFDAFYGAVVVNGIETPSLVRDAVFRIPLDA